MPTIAHPGTGLKFRYEIDQSTGSSDGSTSKARIGELAVQQAEASSSSNSIPTPAIVSYTKKGSPVHLSRDNVDRLPIEMVMLAYEHL